MACSGCNGDVGLIIASYSCVNYNIWKLLMDVDQNYTTSHSDHDWMTFHFVKMVSNLCVFLHCLLLFCCHQTLVQIRQGIHSLSRVAWDDDLPIPLSDVFKSAQRDSPFNEGCSRLHPFGNAHFCL